LIASIIISLDRVLKFIKLVFLVSNLLLPNLLSFGDLAGLSHHPLLLTQSHLLVEELLLSLLLLKLDSGYLIRIRKTHLLTIFSRCIRELNVLVAGVTLEFFYYELFGLLLVLRTGTRY
jgi:hypothetical protein